MNSKQEGKRPLTYITFPKVNAAGARAFSDFMVSGKVREIIGRYGVDKYGSPLFFPDAGKKPESLGL